jgi:hypothetical protein
MDTIIRENDWLARGVSDFGWGNGYVIIPEDHPMYGVHYDEIPVDVHGGLTFSESVKDMDIENWPQIEGIKGGWVVGFDTCHYGDTESRWTKERVQKETDRLGKQLEKLG